MTRILAYLLLLELMAGSFAHAQTISREEIIFLTSEWKGDRFADGRPRIPDDLIERAANIGIEEAWVVMYNAGYKSHSRETGKWCMTMCR